MVTRTPFWILALAAAVCGSAQQPPIRTEVPLVLATVTVTDRKGNPIDGLAVEDFILTDDGVPQTIRMDTSDTVLTPISLIVAVQGTGTSAAALAKINKVGGLIQPLITGERGKAAVLEFDNEVRLLQGLTSDSTKINLGFGKIHAHANDSGRMIDAVAESVKLMSTQPDHSRRILLVLSESRDRGSTMKLSAAIELAQHAGVMIYPITYSAYATPWTAKPEDNPAVGGRGYLGGLIDLARLGKINTADALARSTGGTHLSFETLKGLENTIACIGEEIHSQYLLSFAPHDTGHRYHRIEVLVPSHPAAVVRSRPGYWQ